MDGWTLGFWDVVDLALRQIGKGSVWLLMRKPGKGVPGPAYALIGGALVCTLFGGVVGFALSDFSRNMPMVEGAILGGLLGACMGIFLGSFVEAVDDTINDVLRSVSSK
jgi:hypothetical protein